MGSGGYRQGAGRPGLTGKFGEPTKAIRVPISQVEEILKYAQHRFYKLPLFQCVVQAGFPSPAENEIDKELDLNELLIKHPAATFFVRVAGSSMLGAGIHHDDILVVDRSVNPVSGKIVIAAINGELTVKRLLKDEKGVFLMPENESYSPIEITEDSDLRIWGVVTNVIHNV